MPNRHGTYVDAREMVSGLCPVSAQCLGGERNLLPGQLIACRNGVLSLAVR